MTIRLEPVYRAVQDRMETTGYPVGDHRAPVDGDGHPQTAGRYSIIQSIPGGGFEGSQADAHEIGTVHLQIESYARDARQARWLADANRVALLDHDAITMTGLRCMYSWSTFPGGETDEGDDEDGPLFSIREDFYFQVCSTG